MAKQWLHNTTSGICRVHIFRNKLPDGFQEQEKFLHGKNTVLHKRTRDLKSPKVFHPKDRIQTHKAGLLIAPLFYIPIFSIRIHTFAFKRIEYQHKNPIPCFYFLDGLHKPNRIGKLSFPVYPPNTIIRAILLLSLRD